MKKTSIFWGVVVVGFIVINAGGLIYTAVTGGGAMHMVTHAVLAGAGFVAWQFLRRGSQAQPQIEGAVNERVLDSLQESIDAIALNVERIGEDQRFQARLVKEQLGESGEDNVR